MELLNFYNRGVNIHDVLATIHVSNVRSIMKIQLETQLKEVIIKMYDLKKACKNCLPQSILKYQRDINRLFKLVGKETLPSTGKWLLEPNLMKEHSKLPLSKRRQLSTAAVKALQAYGMEKSSSWDKALLKDTSEYKKNRNLQLKSKTEQSKWPGWIQSLEEDEYRI